MADFGQTDFGQIYCFFVLAKFSKPTKPTPINPKDLKTYTLKTFKAPLSKASAHLVRGFTRQPKNSKRAHFRGPGASNTTEIPREDPQRHKKSEMVAGEEKKKARNFGPSTLLGATPSAPPPPPPSGPPTFSRFGPHPSGPPTLQGLHHLALNFYWVSASVAAFGSPTVEKPTLAAFDLSHLVHISDLRNSVNFFFHLKKIFLQKDLFSPRFNISVLCVL